MVRRDELMVGMDDLSSLSNLNGCTGKNHPVMVMHPRGLGFFCCFPLLVARMDADLPGKKQEPVQVHPLHVQSQ